MLNATYRGRATECRCFSFSTFLIWCSLKKKSRTKIHITARKEYVFLARNKINQWSNSEFNCTCASDSGCSGCVKRIHFLSNAWSKNDCKWSISETADRNLSMQKIVQIGSRTFPFVNKTNITLEGFKKTRWKFVPELKADANNLPN